VSAVRGAARRRRLSPWGIGLAVLVVAAFAVRLWMGSADLHGGRFWDERYTLQNVAELIEEGRAKPANAYHPTLAHLPQAGVLAAARSLCAETPLCADPIVREGRFTPLAYLLARWVQALFGALSLVALYRVGRRMFGPAEGLAAAALLAMVPWHIRQSAIFKPDVLLLLLTIVAFEAALAVAERPTLRRHAAAGLAVGLATAAKYNGFTAGIPLFVATLAGLRRAPRRFLLLAAAAAVAIAVFLALDPHLLTDFWMLQRDFGGTLRDYQRKGEEAGATAGALLVHAVTTLLSAPFHGPVIGAAGLAGLALLGASAFRGGLGSVDHDGADHERPERDGRLMLAGFPLLYAVTYAALTTNPSAHNWLSLAPFTALAAAWLGVRAWWLAAVRWPARVRRPAAVAALALLLAASAGLSFRYAYPATVTTTLDLAELYLVAELPPDLGERVVLYEAQEGRRLVVRLGPARKASVLRLPSDDREAVRALREADAAVVGFDTMWRLGLLDPAATERLKSFRPGFLAAWGPPLVATVRPWCRTGPALPLTGRDGVYTVPAPADGDGAWLSFALLTTPGHDARQVAPVVFAGRELELLWNRDTGAGLRLVTERVEAADGGGPWALEVALADPAAVRDVRMVPWRPPGSQRCGGEG
jgi:hypothetical protein